MRRAPSVPAAGGLALLLAACAAPELHDTPPPALPDAWRAAPAAPAPVAAEGPWWQDFGPELAALVEEAWAANPDLAAAAAAVRAAEAQARIAAGARVPAVGGGLQGERARRNFIGFPIPGARSPVLSTTTTSWGLSLDLSWEVDLWGRLAAAARAGAAAREAAAADLNGARLSLAGQVLKVGLALAEARERIRLLEELRGNQEETAARLRERFRRGLGGAAEVRLAQGRVAATDGVLAAAGQEIRNLQRQLEVLLGRYPEGSAVGPDALPPLPPPPPPGIPATVLARRPDVAAAEARLREARARLDEAEGALYPRLALTASGGTAAAELRDLLDGDFRVWGLLGNLTAPIFQGGRLRAGVDLAAAGLDGATATFAATVLRACGEVETALQAQTDLAAREEAAARAVAEARAAEELARSRWLAGVADVLALLEAQANRLQVEQELLAVRRQRLEARVDLRLALGGAPPAPPAQPAPEQP